MNSAFKEARQRWDVFLGKTEARFHEILAQTETVLPNVLEFQDFDTTTFGVAWQGIAMQAKDLIAKIQDTWQDKVSAVFDEIKDAGEAEVEEAGGSLDEYYERFYPLYYAEQAKGLELADKMDKALKGYEVRTFAEAARKLQQKAAEVLSKSFSCTQCKAPLPVKQNFFRSYYQTCEYCQTVNTFEPGSIARNVEHFALHPLAEEKALPEYYAYWDIENRFRRQRDDEPQVVSPQQVLDAHRLYAEKYLKARIEIIPELEKDYEKDLEAKVEHVRKWVLGEHGWNYINPADKRSGEEEFDDADEEDFEEVDEEDDDE